MAEFPIGPTQLPAEMHDFLHRVAHLWANPSRSATTEIGNTRPLGPAYSRVGRGPVATSLRPQNRQESGACSKAPVQLLVQGDCLEVRMSSSVPAQHGRLSERAWRMPQCKQNKTVRATVFRLQKFETCPVWGANSFSPESSVPSS